jgi:hypothetical protein
MILTLYDLWCGIIVMSFMFEDLLFEGFVCLQYHKVSTFFK